MMLISLFLKIVAVLSIAKELEIVELFITFFITSFSIDVDKKIFLSKYSLLDLHSNISPMLLKIFILGDEFPDLVDNKSLKEHNLLRLL